MITATLSKEKLFAYLIVDDVPLNEQVKAKAKEGDGVSINKIGNIYYNKKEYTKAIDWYRLGAAKNNAHSQNRLGWMYQHGRGVHVNYKLAMEWYLKAHNNGDTQATNSVGYLYDKGQGVAQDYKTALKWYLEAASKGNDCAQWKVGVFYENGYSVQRDIQHALEWYKRSAGQGYEFSKHRIEYLRCQGFYLDTKPEKYLQIEKEMKEQKLKMESLERDLKLSEQNRLKGEQEREKRDREIQLLKQEHGALKLKFLMRTKELPILNVDNINQLGESVLRMNTGEDDSQNDICYDG